MCRFPARASRRSVTTIRNSFYPGEPTGPPADQGVAQRLSWVRILRPGKSRRPSFARTKNSPMIDVGPSSLAGGAPRRSSQRYMPSHRDQLLQHGVRWCIRLVASCGIRSAIRAAARTRRPGPWSRFSNFWTLPVCDRTASRHFPKTFTGP